MKYRVVMEGLNQSDRNEIFLVDTEFNQAIKYVTDKKFSTHFELDIKTVRKHKIDKINDNLEKMIFQLSIITDEEL